MVENCIFCKIAKGEIDCAKTWEDENFLAFLDGNPNVKGMTLVIPKKHFDSYAFDMVEKNYLDLLLATKKVAKMLDQKLKIQRTAMIMEGLGINHVHIKLYPIFGLNEKFKETWSKERIFFEKYEGYISTQLGPKANINELKKLAEEIK